MGMMGILGLIGIIGPIGFRHNRHIRPIRHNTLLGYACPLLAYYLFTLMTSTVKMRVELPGMLWVPRSP